MRSKFLTLTAFASFSLCLMIPQAHADGMPFTPIETPLDAPVVTEDGRPILPLDKALMEIQAQENTMTTIEKVRKEEVPKALIPVAPETRTVHVQDSNPSFFGLSVGLYDAATHGDKRAASFNLEWQPNIKIKGVLQPLFGAIVTTKASMMGYAGFGVPIKFTKNKRLMLMPSLSIGGYSKGDGYDLDSSVAFRLGTEIAYEFNDKSRIGLNIHMLTNGQSFSRNDRTDIISLVYTKPVSISPILNKVKPQEYTQAPFPLP